MARGTGEPVDPGDLRVSDAEREQVQQLLAKAMVAGQITPTEYSDRAAGALAARVRRDLDGLLDDLPGLALHAARSVDVLDLEAGVGGSISRHGYWKVPPTVRVRSWVGGVRLDFTEAEFTTAVVAVDLATGMCSPTLVLPVGATVDVDELRISAGSVRDETDRRRERGSPHVMVRGRHSLGDVTIRHPRRRPRFALLSRDRRARARELPGRGGPGDPATRGRGRTEGPGGTPGRRRTQT